jgi:hypothetical protein
MGFKPPPHPAGIAPVDWYIRYDIDAEESRQIKAEGGKIEG